MLEEIAFEDTKKLLVDLAINFTKKTKFLSVPKGTRVWTIEQYAEFSSYPSKPIMISLIPFFGTYVGYNSEVDILVIWQS